jgi:hypothetical protein
MWTHGGPRDRPRFPQLDQLTDRPDPASHKITRGEWDSGRSGPRHPSIITLTSTWDGGLRRTLLTARRCSLSGQRRRRILRPPPHGPAVQALLAPQEAGASGSLVQFRLAVRSSSHAL